MMGAALRQPVRLRGFAEFSESCPATCSPTIASRASSSPVRVPLRQQLPQPHAQHEAPYYHQAQHLGHALQYIAISRKPAK
jgi:hypothetical protein